MFYLIPSGDAFVVSSIIPEGKEYYEVEQLPEGYGQLKMDESGQFYYEPFPEELPISVPPVSEPVDLQEIQIRTMLNTEYLLLLAEFQ